MLSYPQGVVVKGGTPGAPRFARRAVGYYISVTPPLRTSIKFYIIFIDYLLGPIKNFIKNFIRTIVILGVWKG